MQEGKIWKCTENEWRKKQRGVRYKKYIPLPEINTTKIKDDLCSQLRATRIEKKISQYKIAEDVGVDRRTVNRTENLCDCNIDTFVRLATYLGYDVVLVKKGE